MWLSDYFVSSCVNLTAALYCINIGTAVQNAAFHTGIENGIFTAKIPYCMTPSKRRKHTNKISN